MFSYYGAKTNIAHLYPPPLHGKIIEPFAGSARYALKYWEMDILIVDKFERLINVWHYLQQASSKEILQLPEVKIGQSMDDFTFDCQGQRDLVGFLIGYGLTHPANKPSEIKQTHRPGRYETNLKRIANDLHKIRHWDIRCGSYDELENENATWFIDPPYQFGGRNYSASNRYIDFHELAEWCKIRKGQVIVCENTKANWLPFYPLKTIRGAQGKSTESVWTNQPTSFNCIQNTFDFNCAK